LWNLNIEFEVDDLVVDDMKGKFVAFTFYNSAFKEVIVGRCFIYTLINGMIISMLPSETKDDIKAYIVSLFYILEKLGLRSKDTSPTERIAIFKNEDSYLVFVMDEKFEPDMLEQCIKAFSGKGLRTDFFFTNSKYRLVEVYSPNIN